ncbi:hypothetical protein KY310_01255 [Candidatus Woesearchaeota archaeon]|nr:hypothetical protein [Candidatus Woesearchaeota archaeon]
MRSTDELRKLVESRLDGRPADKFTLERLVPDMSELEGFTDDQLIAVVTGLHLRVPYCCYCDSRIKPNGKWIDIPESYRALIRAKKYLPKNQTLCDRCGDYLDPGYAEFLEANKEFLDSFAATGTYDSEDSE